MDFKCGMKNCVFMMMFVLLWGAVSVVVGMPPPPNAVIYPPPVNCSTLSPPENSKYWDAAEYCYSCASAWNCGYCQSTMKCEAGNMYAPFSGLSCPNWAYQPEACPVNPGCQHLTSCGLCAAASQCVWCTSDATCLALEECAGSSCSSFVFEEPCPTVVVPRKYSVRLVF